MNGKSWAIFAGIVVVLLGGLVFFAMQGKLDVSDVPQEQLVKGTIPPEPRNGNIGDNSFGNKDHKVVLIEYGDFQCPGCFAAHSTIKEVTEKYKDQLTFVFRNMPIVSIHPNARAAAAAVEAAGLQGKYWEMNNLMYQNQQNWSNLSVTERGEEFKRYATQIGIDPNRLEQDMGSSNVAKKIDFDTAIAGRQQATETPYFFLNGERLNQYFKDGKLVDSSVDGAQQVWADPTAFENLVIRPALEKAGFKLDDIK